MLPDLVGAILPLFHPAVPFRFLGARCPPPLLHLFFRIEELEVLFQALHPVKLLPDLCPLPPSTVPSMTRFGSRFYLPYT